MDISADLQEFANTPVCVVSAGCKAILDIGLTLEYLETFGVPVLGYQTKEFPAFYSRTSGFNVDYCAKETTPFLLATIKDLTGGDSLASNLQLAYNNAKVASKIAVEYSKLS